MKKIKFISTLLIGLSLFSCDNSLDLEPEDSLTPSVVFSNEALSNSALNGMYSSCQSSDALSGTLDAITEWQTDNVNFVGSFPTFQEIRDYSTLSDNTSITPLWTTHYRVINQANMIIKFVPLSPDVNFSNAAKDDMVGQAKFIRALMHFRLSNVFGVQFAQNPSGDGLSVPLVLAPFEGTITYPNRSTLLQVYNQIEDDLLDATILITNTTKSKATVAAAKGLLARLYLYQGRWSEAANMANDVINTSGISLAANYAFYNANSTEHVFQLLNIAGDAAGAQSYSNLFNGTNFGARGDCPFSQDLRNLFALEPGDIRISATLTRNGTSAAGVTDLFTRKYPNGTTNVDDPNVIRVSEMFLIRAEANLRNGSTIGATPVADVNRTRNRAGLTSLVSVTLDDILVERRKEFCFEGLRRMDLLRFNLPLRSDSLPNSAVSTPTSPKVIFPIPQREIDINPNLIQNSGY